MSYYRGWFVYSGPPHPVTGAWRAVRHGVRMGTTTKAGLHSMIDQRIADEGARVRDGGLFRARDGR